MFEYLLYFYSEITTIDIVRKLCQIQGHTQFGIRQKIKAAFEKKNKTGKFKKLRKPGSRKSFVKMVYSTTLSKYSS